jgi:hypothetical protein
MEVTRLGEECLVNIPDANFKNYLLANTDINTNEDNEIQCAEAENYSGNMIVLIWYSRFDGNRSI